jgi:hypothetical protein
MHPTDNLSAGPVRPYRRRLWRHAELRQLHDGHHLRQLKRRLSHRRTAAGKPETQSGLLNGVEDAWESYSPQTTPSGGGKTGSSVPPAFTKAIQRP